VGLAPVAGGCVAKALGAMRREWQMGKFGRATRLDNNEGDIVQQGLVCERVNWDAYRRSIVQKTQPVCGMPELYAVGWRMDVRLWEYIPALVARP
jgi:hypothetical protein